MLGNRQVLLLPVVVVVAVVVVVVVLVLVLVLVGVGGGGDGQRRRRLAVLVFLESKKQAKTKTLRTVSYLSIVETVRCICNDRLVLESGFSVSIQRNRRGHKPVPLNILNPKP